MVTKKAIGTG